MPGPNVPSRVPERRHLDPFGAGVRVETTSEREMDDAPYGVVRDNVNLCFVLCGTDGDGQGDRCHALRDLRCCVQLAVYRICDLLFAALKDNMRAQHNMHTL